MIKAITMKNPIIEVMSDKDKVSASSLIKKVLLSPFVNLNLK